MKGSEKSVCSEGAVLSSSHLDLKLHWVVVEVAETLGVANSEGKMTSR